MFELPEEDKVNEHLMNCITLEELQANCMPLEEILKIKHFSNYEAGEPSVKLYVKNLAKDVTEDDLKYIFGRYFPNKSIMDSDLKIDLLKKKMKGQCFISFPNVYLAKKALSEVNGHVLHEKPMIIAFGKVKQEEKK